MRYLKSFNEETNFKFEDELKEFCELNLVYLIDEGLEVHVDKYNLLGNYSHSMKDRKHGYAVIIDLIEPKKWNDIKDQVIPFLTRLNSNYQIDKMISSKNTTLMKRKKIEDIYLKDNNISMCFLFNGATRTREGSNMGYLYCNIDKLINDYYIYNSFITTCEIKEIRFKVLDYKKIEIEKKPKSFISKIKSFI